MSPPETREQRLEAKRKKMPLDLADLHWHLEDELTSLHLSWKEYETLYATNDRRIELLNATAPNFFVHFEDMVWRETMMHLCRLTDPPEFGRKDKHNEKPKEKLTVLRLSGAIDDMGLKNKVEKEAKQRWKRRALRVIGVIAESPIEASSTCLTRSSGHWRLRAVRRLRKPSRHCAR